MEGTDRKRLDVERSIAQINARLEAAGSLVKVCLKGKSALVLRATLPKKPSEGPGNKQQYLSLSIRAHADGFKRIEEEAKHLSSLINLGRFSWDLYLPVKTEEVKAVPVCESIAGFKIAHFNQYKIKESTWQDSWQKTFDALPQREPLSEAAILAVVLKTEPHTRSRELVCQRLNALAKFAELKIDLSAYRGSYSEQMVTPRDLPSEFTIRHWRDRVPHEGWQWVYGMIATFGIRPHEAFFCHFISDYKLQVREGKTGPRVARAIMPELVERWDLTRIIKPEVTGKTYRTYGQRCALQFRRYKIPFVPYDLRHHWAVYASVVKKLPYAVSAKAMGHSIPVHTDTYHRWISEAMSDRIYDELILGESWD
jgi:integrase